MALRTFTDSAGTEWKVWDVIPSWIREQDAQAAPEGERGAGLGRRTLLTPGLERGWLCFESDSEKRRLTPIPPDWDERTDRELEALCESASPRPKVS